MSGTKIGAAKSVAKILAKNPNHFKEAGKIGGQHGVGHSYGHGKASPVENGRRGGLNSIRGFKYLGTFPDGRHYQRRTDGEIVVK